MRRRPFAGGLSLAAAPSLVAPGRGHPQLRYRNRILADFDPARPDLMSLRPVRTLNGSTQAFAYNLPSNSPFCFPGDGTTSKFLVSFWLRVDGQPGNGVLYNQDSAVVLGALETGASPTERYSWALLWRTTGANGGLQLNVGTNSTGTTHASVLWANFFNPTGNCIQTGLWNHICLIYDGSQHGTTSVVTAYLNGAAAATPAAGTSSGTQVTQHVSTLATGNNAQFAVGPQWFSSIGNGRLAMSICDIALCSTVPANNAAAVSAIFNHGRGGVYPFSDWPLDAPSLLEFYQGDDNANLGTGQAPSGNMLGKINGGTYQLQAIGAPTGEMQVSAWRSVDTSRSIVFGRTPLQLNGQRIFEGVWSKTGRQGKPGVYCRPVTANNVFTSAYAIGDWSTAKTDLAAAGSMFVNMVVDQRSSADNCCFGVVDDRTGTGQSGGGQRYLGIGIMGQTPFLYQAAPINASISIGANSTVTTSAPHGMKIDDGFYFTLNGTLPTDATGSASGVAHPSQPLWNSYGGLVSEQLYLVKALDGATPTTKFTYYSVVDSQNGSRYPITTSGSYSGQAQIIPCPYSAVSGRYSPNLRTCDGTLAPLYNFAIGEGRLGNTHGVEISGVAIDGATYPATGSGTPVVIEATNNGNGALAPSKQVVFGINGPYELWVNNILQPTELDDAGTGHSSNVWGASWTDLNTICLNCDSRIDGNGAWSVRSGQSGWYGELLITRQLSPAARAQFRKWLQAT